jgi:two-component sensor histidine kinase
MKVLDLNTILRDLDKMLRRVIGEDIELVTLLADDLGTVKADAGQIEQVIMNLAVNARDAMQKGGKLTIETANVELDENYARNHVAVKPGSYVMLSVSDTGVGMTPEVRDRVFEPFFTTKEKGKGTGLGLSTVYGIVKQSGGNIWVYSEPGKGTTFKIYLPRVDEPPEEAGEKVVQKEIAGRGETILVVEDEEKVRQLTVQILTQNGYTVLEAPQGDEASHICKQRKGPIHLMVMCGDARNEWPRVSQISGIPSSGDEGALYVRLYRQCHCPSWHSGERTEFYPEAFYHGWAVGKSERGSG